MKRFLLILVISLLCKPLFAEHITGGEMYYRFLGMSGDKYRYRVTLKLYRDCFSAGAPLDEKAAIGIFNRSNGGIVWQESIDLTRSDSLHLESPGPCIGNPPIVCYEVGFYEFEVELAASTNGYTIAYQRCCRINGISNLAGSGTIGATYMANIPGTAAGPTAPANNSARFTGIDTVIVCGGYPFTYSFGAIDTDPTEQLRYSFCSAYTGGGTGNGTGYNSTAPNPPAGPPYSGVSYRSPYSGVSPLGPAVTINPNTGLIAGLSPEQGIYVVTVCVEEIRNGVVIATQRKDLQIKAGGCDIAKPQLKPEYINCDGFSFSFSQPNNPLVNTYNWDFGDPASGIANNSSTLQNPTHVFSAAGVYTFKVVANRGQECSDSATAIIRVFPGFFPAFSSAGVCINNPVQFSDGTQANYGVVNSWSWDFGDNLSPGTSSDQDPSWKYTSPGNKNVRLIVGSSVGCTDTIFHELEIIDKPPITLAFRDTLICVPDNVQLQASGTGIFNWTPLTAITNAGTGNPTVNPTTTTTYQVKLDQEGCINTDSVLVRVVRTVTVNAMNDTTICLTDPVTLNINSDGLQYQWTPAASLDDPSLQDPVAIPTDASTNYHVIARIGSCSTPADILVRTVPYPFVNAGLDTTICYNTPAVLQGSHNGNSFSWSPISSLVNSNTLTPTAYPPRNQAYVLRSTDIRGCPKPSYDTVLVNVLPRIMPYAGRDTMVIVGQPLQLNAEGGISYQWTPNIGLNNPGIKNPLAVYDAEIDSVRYTVEVFNQLGCSDSAFVNVVVFKTNPYIFVPSAFTPNGDGLNDEIRPIAVGVERILYFKIFNRWGQLLFTTTENGKGWDGKIAGTPQGSNVFVWMVSAIDYTGKPVFLKGTTTLIR